MIEPAAARPEAHRAMLATTVRQIADAFERFAARLVELVQPIVDALTETFRLLDGWVRLLGLTERRTAAQLGATGLRADDARHRAHWRRHAGRPRPRRRRGRRR